MRSYSGKLKTKIAKFLQEQWPQRKSRSPILSSSVSLIGNRQLSEIVCYNVGKGFMQSLVFGGLVGLASPPPFLSRNSEAQHTLSTTDRLDRSIEYATQLSSIGAATTLLFTGCRWGVHAIIPLTLVKPKIARTVLAGGLTGATIGALTPAQKAYCSCRFSLLCAAVYTSEFLWANNRMKLKNYLKRQRELHLLPRWERLGMTITGCKTFLKESLGCKDNLEEEPFEDFDP
eukprot:Gregarina_sp_Poly_1__1026@NODE_1250_length_4632_cov_65_352683_g851_i0_p2_GENE_NODE_1250_length_4632_cov_65_352683_g851_i0NODE_1250_length_4632_cov_65_352683_g851_i0_p2_ORF_typecomplete_len231_score27_19Tim17/PF02466_19/0_013_NODE_1250_length_4632_cov_65_352683_g851_i030523744